MRRTTFKLLGLGCVAAGIVGIFLPVMPTTIFFILAAGAFARSSPELERRILEHPKYGPPVRNWRENGVVPVKAKLYALSGMAFGFIVFLWVVHPQLWLAVAVGLFMVACGLYVGTRPSVARPGPGS